MTASAAVPLSGIAAAGAVAASEEASEVENLLLSEAEFRTDPRGQLPDRVVGLGCVSPGHLEGVLPQVGFGGIQPPGGQLW
ncbi:hypothetical protein [Nonomuraea sp. NPDC002799]